MLLGLLGPVPGWMCCNAWREGLRKAQHGSPLLQPPCSQSAHRRCAHTRTSQHTSVVNLQVRHTTVDASRLRWTGWRGSNPGIPTASTRANALQTAECKRFARVRPPGRPVRSGGTPFRRSARRFRPATHSTGPTWRSVGSYLRMGRPIQCVRSFDIKIITVMRSCWEKTARRPRITRRWWAPPGMQDEENQQP